MVGILTYSRAKWIQVSWNLKQFSGNLIYRVDGFSLHSLSKRLTGHQVYLKVLWRNMVLNLSMNCYYWLRNILWLTPPKSFKPLLFRALNFALFSLFRRCCWTFYFEDSFHFVSLLGTGTKFRLISFGSGWRRKVCFSQDVFSWLSLDLKTSSDMSLN